MNNEVETPIDPHGQERANLHLAKLLDECGVKLKAAKFVLAERERELLALKGPCSTCRLHYAHSGPCDPIEEVVG